MGGAYPSQPSGLLDILDVLGCLFCDGRLQHADGTLRCDLGHTFDIARQGYVSLLEGGARGLRADTGAMVAARARIHDSEVLRPVVDAVAARSGEHLERVHQQRPLIVDAGAGGGHYLRACRQAYPQSRGVGIDLSRHCARAIARSEPPNAALVADVWSRLPVRDGVAGVVLSVFAPRNVREFARILRSDGVLIVVRPQPDHLAEIVGPMEMIGIDEAKAARLHTALEDLFETEDEEISETVEVGADSIADLVAMGPSAFHHDAADIRSRALRFAGEARKPVTVSVTMTVCRPPM